MSGKGRSSLISETWKPRTPFWKKGPTQVICNPCSEAGRANGDGEIKIAEELHELCVNTTYQEEDNTHCDCLHRVGDNWVQKEGSPPPIPQG